MRINLAISVSLAATFVSCSALAAVSPEEAKQLGTTLTPWGAEKAGNKDGTIPAYTGERIKVPASYDPKNPKQHPDPFNEKPLFTITAQNMAQYAERLTEGQKALFKTHPDFHMDVYPSHRTANYPKYVLDNTAKNATSCKAVENGLKLEGCYGGLAFPIPKTGNEVMWNHLVAYEGHSVEGKLANWIVNPTGAPTLSTLNLFWKESPYYDPNRKGVNTPKDIYYKLRADDIAPARRVGQKLVLVNALDQVGIGQRAWQYIPGQRRVKLAPDLSYDTPNPVSGGSQTMDDSTGFYGPLDRFDWKLVGKQEKYIVYNSYANYDVKNCPDEKLTATKHFPNPDCMRWELHRVWVVEGKLKPGYRHIYARRTLYWDEDGYSAGTGETYDAGGHLYRVITVMPLTLYETGVVSGQPSIIMDMRTGIWTVNGSNGLDGGGITPAPAKEEAFFSPEALAGEGIR